MMGKAKKITTINSADEFIACFLQSNKPRARSLISTFFGDLVQLYGGKAWVETMSQILKPLEINERLVRTSLFRLCEENWLFGTRSGRKSYYQLTSASKSLTRFAEKIIYYPQKSQWDGSWTLLFIVMQPIDKQARQKLEQQLAWLGLGVVAKHVWAHPSISLQRLSEQIKHLNMQNQVVCMRANNIHDLELGFAVDDKAMVAQCMQVGGTEEKYRKFYETFLPLLLSIDLIKQESNPMILLALRVLLIDEYRRIVLTDPRLPIDLLPHNWIGTQAAQLCRDIYLSLFDITNQSYRDVLNKVDFFEGDRQTATLKKSYSNRFMSTDC